MPVDGMALIFMLGAHLIVVVWIGFAVWKIANKK